MLKLVDGTELTAEVKEAFKKSVTSAYIKLEDGTILSSRNYLKTLKIEDFRYNEETDNIIGEAVSKRVTLGLFNQENDLNIENKEFELVIGTKLSEYEENNFYNVDDILLISKDMIINDDDSVTATFDNTNGTEIQFLNLFANVSGFLETNSEYVAVLEILDISGTGSLTITDSSIEPENFSSFSTGTAVKYKLKSLDNFLNSDTVLKTYVKFNPGESGTITFRISILENDVNINNFEYNKFNNNNRYISFGNFIVQKPENNDTKESTELEAFDYMCKFNQTYVPGVEFPCTYAELAEDVCNQCGVELGNKTFRNADKLIYENFFIDNEQCRVVVKEIAKIAFSWARMATDNKLYFDFAKRDIKTPDEVFTLDDYIELEPNEKTIPVNTIILSNSAVESENITIKDDALISEYGRQKELVIKEDYFAYSQEKRQELIEASRELIGLVYNPVLVKSIGTIYLESNDIIGIQDKKGNIRGTYCFNHTIDFNGVLYDNIESPAMTETETKYQHESSDELSRRRTEILVNKATQEIKLLVENVKTYDARISSVEVGLDDITAKIQRDIDITRTSDGIKSITLENCMAGELLELHIYGNNTVFDYLLPSDDLLPSDNLLPYGDSRIKVTSDNILSLNPEDWENGFFGGTDGKVYHNEPYNSSMLVMKQKINMEDATSCIYNLIDNYKYRIYAIACYDKNDNFLGIVNNGHLKDNTAKILIDVVKKDFSMSNEVYPSISPNEISESQLKFQKVRQIELGIKEVLRQKGDIRDSFDLVNNKASITRRIGVTEDGTLYVLNEPVIENLGELVINLVRGTNVIEILNYEAMLSAKFIIINNFTEQFVSTVEFKSAVEIFYNQINLEVAKKVGNDEIIARINMAVLGKDQVEIPEDIEKSIIEILANKIAIKSDYFELTKEGEITAVLGKIGGWTLNYNTLYSTITENGKEIEAGLFATSSGNGPFFYCGHTPGESIYNANFYVTHSGFVNCNGINMNGESSNTVITFDSGRKALWLGTDHLSFYIDDDSNNFFGGIVKLQNGFRWYLNSAFFFEIYDYLHDQLIVDFHRHDDSGNDGYINLYKKTWYYGGSGTGYEVATKNEISDKKAKKNIKNTKLKGLERINKIDFIEFDWDEEKVNKKGHIDIGVLANQLKEIDENFVDTTKVYKLNGKDEERKEEEFLSINVLNVLTTTMKATQELSKENKALNEKIERQQKMIDFLAKKLGCMEEMEEMLNGESDKLV